MRSRTLLLACAAALLAPGGCQRLNLEKTYSIAAAEYEEITIDPPQSDQKVTVTIKPTAGPVSAFLIKSDGLVQVKQAVDREKDPPAELVYGKRLSQSKEDYTFEGTVPAKTEFTLLLKNGPVKNEVAVKMTGR